MRFIIESLFSGVLRLQSVTGKEKKEKRERERAEKRKEDGREGGKEGGGQEGKKESFSFHFWSHFIRSLSRARDPGFSSFFLHPKKREQVPPCPCEELLMRGDGWGAGSPPSQS